ncbi:expressed unknown protein [Seminavis robusta]|uniref:Uncharacterized protein n=1 Tax=Seminavis robusta TaxID=568900 RepID=A0A9N8DC31_9STRA|nr:expressed unknown protein [Seminavis robusta]|eukprot:Sro76_g041470.1 n/a (132) ;mRNA; f:4685-5080
MAATATASSFSKRAPSFSKRGPTSVSLSDRKVQQQKERFRLFTRVLLTYLKSKDPEMALEVKVIIRDCKARNVRKEKGFESVTASMRLRIKELVGEAHWRRAEHHLARYLANKEQRRSRSTGSEDFAATFL